MRRVNCPPSCDHMTLKQVYYENQIEQDVDRECQRGGVLLLQGSEEDKYWPKMRMTLQTVSIG